MKPSIGNDTPVVMAKTNSDYDNSDDGIGVDGHGDDGNDNSNDPSFILLLITQPFTQNLAPTTIQIIENGPFSPQVRANLWMVSDPLLREFPLDRQMLRFALTTMYYATGGDGLLDCHRHACG